MISEKLSRILDLIKIGNIEALKEELSFDPYEEQSNKRILEKNYYKLLYIFLQERDFNNFKSLLDLSAQLDIFLDAKKIPSRFDVLSKIHINGIRTGQIAQIFEAIKLFNKYNLLEVDIPKEEMDFIQKIKDNKLILENLEDLFGDYNDYLIYFTFKLMLDNILKLFRDYFRFPEDSNETIDLFYRKDYLLRFFNNYSMYGLRIENIGSVEEFIGVIKAEELQRNQKSKKGSKDKKLLEFQYKNRTHLISKHNIDENIDNILNNRNIYKFYSVSMVLLGGLGPEGHGFTYSTPRGEIIEVCSDRKESRAIIIRYKEFLTKRFLLKLKEQMKLNGIEEALINDLLVLLSTLLKPKEIIDFRKKEPILSKIKAHFDQNKENYDLDSFEYEEIYEKIEDSITLILRPINMVDQFKCRMDLIEEGKLQSEEIAKLTSLGLKSHYDVLRERFFFQEQIEWFYKRYAKEVRTML